LTYSKSFIALFPPRLQLVPEKSHQNVRRGDEVVSDCSHVSMCLKSNSRAVARHVLTMINHLNVMPLTDMVATRQITSLVVAVPYVRWSRPF
jgi:hypothetical protein